MRTSIVRANTVQDELWILLQLGILQLVFLDHISPHAAVNETVELCGRMRLARAKGLVNGVLRCVEREMHREAGVESPQSRMQSLVEFASAPRSSDELPIAVSKQGQLAVKNVNLSRVFLANPATDQLAYISQVASLPRWLVDRWMAQFSDSERILRLGLWFTTPGRMSLRLNQCETTRERALDVLHTAGVDAFAGTIAESITLNGTVAVGDLPGFREGWFSVQDELGMAAVDVLAPQPGERILDLCAAPGGKTCHLAERLAGTGNVVACDVSKERLAPVVENVSRLRLRNVETLLVSPDGNELRARPPFDAVLVDVPCSNTGVLGKRPEARWRISPSSFETLIPQQCELLDRAISLTKPGGRIMYSTCSIDREENESVVHHTLGNRPDSRLAVERMHWPGEPADGGYQALLHRS